MKDILFVYNLCGLKHDNTDKWIEIINKWLSHRDDFDFCISACNVTPECKHKFLTHFKDKDIKINFVEDKLPVNITFNLSCKLNPGYKYYLYCSSDVEPNAHLNIFPKLLKFHKENNNGITGVHVLHDSFHQNHNYIRDIVRKTNYTFKPGESFNCHFALYDGEFIKYYNSFMPDVFESFATESVFYYVCAAINKNLGMLSGLEITLFHPHHDMDGSSSFTKNRGYQFLFLIGDAKERLITDEARQAGFGYEEVNHIMPHKKELYENNKCKNPTKLLGFVKKAVYLQPNEFNYMDINYDSKLI